MDPTAPPDDPKPQAPEPPDLDACCGNGCSPCIFDLHDLAMDEYRQALRAWQARQPATPSASITPAGASAVAGATASQGGSASAQ